MDIKKRKKYLLALAQVTPTVTSPASPASPTSPTSPPSKESPESPEAPKEPSAASAPPISVPSIFPYLNKIWTGNTLFITNIINLIHSGLHVLSGGRVNVDYLKRNSFNFNAARGMMATMPGKLLLAYFESMYNLFLKDAVNNVNAKELTSEQKEDIKNTLINQYNTLSVVNVKNLPKENIRSALNSINTTTEPTTKEPAPTAIA